MKEIAQEIEGIWTSGKSLARKRQDTEALLQCALADPASDLAALREALQGLVDRHAALVNSGDCGFWKVEEEPAMLAARAALARTERRPA